MSYHSDKCREDIEKFYEVMAWSNKPIDGEVRCILYSLIHSIQSLEENNLKLQMDYNTLMNNVISSPPKPRSWGNVT